MLAGYNESYKPVKLLEGHFGIDYRRLYERTSPKCEGSAFEEYWMKLNKK